MKTVIEASVALDLRMPADADIFAEFMRIKGPCNACGQAVTPEDANFPIPKYMEQLHEKSKHLIPKRMQIVVRAMMGHTEYCRG